MRSFLVRQIRSLAPMFRPPFDGLWLAVVLYYFWCFLVYPHSQILRGNLFDPDDYMYLTQVLDWLQGQGWYDNIQHRLNPPDGVPIHFSRFAQMPMAALILVFQLLGLGPRGAATIMAMIYPLFLLSGFLFAIRWLAQSFMPKNWSGVTAYVALFTTGMIYMFMPGHVDHHGLIVLLVTLALGFALRMMQEPDNLHWGLGAGLVLAFGLAVALEILPWLLVLSAGLGLWAAAKGGMAARNGLVFGLSLHLGSTALLLLIRPPEQFFTPDILAYSFVYVLLTGGIAAAFAAIAVTTDMRAWARWVAGTGVAALAGFVFLNRFPELVHGPYGGIDPQLVPLILGEIDEAQPLIKLKETLIVSLTRLGGVAVAGIAGFAFLRRARAGERWRWGLLMAMLTGALLLTLFYQYRFMAVMGMLTIIPLAVLLQRGWKWIGGRWEGRQKVFAELGLLLLVGPLPMVLFPALVDGRSFNTGILLFPVDAGATRVPCDTYALEKILKDPKLYGGHSRLILSSMGQGPEFLFRTPHKVLAAPFHMDVSGNIDATRFFSTPYAAEAEAIAHRRHADLVVACRFVPNIFIRPPEGLKPAKGGSASQDTMPHFIELLMAGKTPAWLRRAEFPGLTNYVIYEVLPSRPSGSKARG